MVREGPSDSDKMTSEQVPAGGQSQPPGHLGKHLGGGAGRCEGCGGKRASLGLPVKYRMQSEVGIPDK